MAMFKKVCCCSLRTCVLILGWFSFIMSVIQTSGALYLVITRTNCTDMAKQIFANNNDDMKAFTDHCELAYKYHLVYVLAGVGIVFFLCCLLLLCGVYLSKPALLIPYTIIFIIAMIGDLAGSVWIIVDKHWETYILGIMIGVTAVKLLINIYILLCIVSYYQVLKESDKGESKGKKNTQK